MSIFLGLRVGQNISRGDAVDSNGGDEEQEVKARRNKHILKCRREEACNFHARRGQ